MSSFEAANSLDASFAEGCWAWGIRLVGIPGSTAEVHIGHFAALEAASGTGCP